MHRILLEPPYALAICVVAWLFATASPLDASPALDTPAAGSETPRQGPLRVENPYLGQQPPVPTHATFPAHTSTPTPAPQKQQSASSKPIAGATVDSDVPVAYRLPAVSSFAPVPVDTAASAPPQLILPPQPPSVETINSTQTRAATNSQITSEPRSAKHQVAGSDASRSAASGPISSASPPSDVESSEISAELDSVDIQAEQSLATGSSDSGIPLAEPNKQDENLKTPPSPLQHTLPFEPPAPATLSHVSTTAELDSQLLPVVRRGYDLAQRGALYAGKTEFIQVLRRIAQAKDAALGTDEHSRALAAGMRALDEANDFVPQGTQLEADLDVWIAASSHRTPVFRPVAAKILPHHAVALYHNYAENQLAMAVAGEQAGSMALHGLGKIDALLAERNDEDVQLATRATTMYTAALAARPDNHLAANELGVLLCRTGRPMEAAMLFERTIDAAPSALAYHNLAVAQQKLGMLGQAAANEQESQRLAAWERASGTVSRRAGVQWVSPAEMARIAQPGQVTPTAYNATTSISPVMQTNAAAAPTPAKSPWRKTVELAKALPIPGNDSTGNIQRPISDVRVSRSFVAPPVPSQTQWR